MTTTQPTLTATLWPATTETRAKLLRGAVLALIGTALIALSARIQVPMWPVPMTMQTFAVLVIGMAYGARLGAATLVLYLAEGAVGLPVFASGGGIAYFAGPTTGYLLGFLIAAVLVGWLAERGFDRSVSRAALAMALGTVAIFLPGVAWLSAFLGSVEAGLANGLVPFIPGAVLKLALAAAALPLAWKFLARR